MWEAAAQTVAAQQLKHSVLYPYLQRQIMTLVRYICLEVKLLIICFLDYLITVII